MLRLIGFFLIVLVVWQGLQFVPILGGIPFVGFWISVLIVSWALNRAGALALERQRDRNAIRELGAVDSPYNRGKLGSLLFGRGRYRAALPHLTAAVEGDPESSEWKYKLGAALLATGHPGEAQPLLEQVVERDEEYAFGAGLLRLAEARIAAGEPEAALGDLDRFDRNHGEGPESLYRRGRALQRLGRGPAAKEAFARVGRFARDASEYHRREANKWALRAWFARLF